MTGTIKLNRAPPREGCAVMCNATQSSDVQEYSNVGVGGQTLLFPWRHEPPGMTYREESCTCSQSSSPSLQGRLCLPPRPMWSKNQESNLRHQLKGPPFISSVPCYQPTEMTLPVRGLGRGTTFVTTNFPVTWTHGEFCSALSALLKLLVASSKILGKVLI